MASTRKKESCTAKDNMITSFNSSKLERKSKYENVTMLSNKITTKENHRTHRAIPISMINLSIRTYSPEKLVNFFDK